jgi:hypothetical protein
MNTAVIMVPSIFPEDFRPHFPENLEPEKAKARVDELLADGYRIKIMNDFVYGQVAFTHYVLEKENFV